MALSKCPNCGYSLRGHTGDSIRCPECGQIAIDRFEGVQFRDSDHTIVGLICGSMFLCGAGIGMIAWTDAGFGFAGVAAIAAVAGVVWAGAAAGHWRPVWAVVTAWFWIVLALGAVMFGPLLLSSLRLQAALPPTLRYIAIGAIWVGALFALLRGRRGLVIRWLNAAAELMRTIALR